MIKFTRSQFLQVRNLESLTISTQGNMGEKHLDIRALYTQTGMFLFDPGFTVTGSCVSAISYSNEKGLLLYRGYTI